MLCVCGGGGIDSFNFDATKLSVVCSFFFFFLVFLERCTLGIMLTAILLILV